METIVPTVYSSHLTISRKLGVNYTPLTNTTLNEKFNIGTGIVLGSNTYPKFNCFVIGNGGHYVAEDSNGNKIPKVMYHNPTDAALYNHIPFILRPVNNDLSPVERSNYRLRKIITIGTNDYIAYYAKKIDTSSITINMENISKVSNQFTSTTFTPDSSNLSPSIPSLDPTHTVGPEADYIGVNINIDLSITTAEMTEIRNACAIIYNDANMAVISEMGICAGVDNQINSTYNSVTINYLDSLYTIIDTFIHPLYVLRDVKSDITLNVQYGTTYPIIKQ